LPSLLLTLRCSPSLLTCLSSPTPPMHTAPVKVEKYRSGAC
jgi:hypothetical protein